LPGTSSAPSAPIGSTTAATGSAATTPSLKACGEAYEPLALNRRQHRDAHHAAELADRVGRARWACEMPVAFAMSIVGVPCRPRAANTRPAAVRISSRHASAVDRVR